MSELTTVLTRAGLLTPEQREHWKMSWLSTVDHKRIGVLYMVTALVFFVLAGLEALYLRIQMPVLFGLANYIVPLQIGARDMAFPRLNAFGFWLVPFGGILLYFSFVAGNA